MRSLAVRGALAPPTADKDLADCDRSGFDYKRWIFWREKDAMSTHDAIPGRSSERTRLDILNIAIAEFADKGYSGARIDEIAARTNTSKRMIYYYFGSKNGLYRAALEAAYSDIRTTESIADVGTLPPVDALRRLTEVTFDYHVTHPEFVRLVMNENMQRGAAIGDFESIRTRSASVITVIKNILERGCDAKVFRSDIDPLDLHMSMSALSFYNVSNLYTFETIFNFDLHSEEGLATRRVNVVRMILEYCLIDKTR